MHDVLSSDPFDAAAFRRLMGQFATGVCVVSAKTDDGDIAGVTVNSFVSVSLDPPLVCWSVQNTSSQFDLWSQTPEFAISILSEDQHDLALRYASRGSDAFVKDDFIFSRNGLPVISNSLGHIECRQWNLYPAGDHTMILGEVNGIFHKDNGRPLVFFGGAFCRISD